MKTFKKLPTSQEFLDLTQEQKELLWDNYLLDNPELERKLTNRFNDSEFEEVWESLGVQEDSKGFGESLSNLDREEDYSEIEASYSDFVKSEGDSDTFDYREVLKRKGIVLDNENLDNVEDWIEEVDDDVARD